MVNPPSPQPVVQQVPPRASQGYPPPPPSNTGKTVALTIMGTLVVLGLGAILFWFLQKEAPANKNINANFGNINTNINTSLPIDSNFNFNTGGSTVSPPTTLNLN